MKPLTASWFEEDLDKVEGTPYGESTHDGVMAEEEQVARGSIVSISARMAFVEGEEMTGRRPRGLGKLAKVK